VNHLAIRLAEAGRRAEALSTAHEAANLYRELVTLNRDAYLPDLAASVNNLANRLAEVFQRAIDSGHPEQAPRAAINLGVLLAEQDPPDVAGARAAHQQAIDSGHPDWVPAAMVILSSVLAVQGDTNGARILLGKAGVVGARAYAAALDDDPARLERARVELGELAAGGDTDALNFLGVLAWHSKALDEAGAAWKKSYATGDVAAPLLLWLCGLPRS
jgi:hypothetical protein